MDMDQQTFNDHVKNASSLNREEILEILTFISEQVEKQDPMLLELSQPRLLKSFYAFSQVCLELLNQPHQPNLSERGEKWLQEACYGLDSDSRRELQSD